MAAMVSGCLLGGSDGDQNLLCLLGVWKAMVRVDDRLRTIRPSIDSRSEDCRILDLVSSLAIGYDFRASVRLQLRK